MSLNTWKLLDLGRRRLRQAGVKCPVFKTGRDAGVRRPHHHPQNRFVWGKGWGEVTCRVVPVPHLGPLGISPSLPCAGPVLLCGLLGWSPGAPVFHFILRTAFLEVGVGQKTTRAGRAAPVGTRRCQPTRARELGKSLVTFSKSGPRTRLGAAGQIFECEKDSLGSRAPSGRPGGGEGGSSRFHFPGQSELSLGFCCRRAGEWPLTPKWGPASGPLGALSPQN